MEGRLLYLFLALVPLFLVLSKRRRRGDMLRLPPGPWQLPVIGSLHHMAGQLPHRAMRDLARRYGPVMLLHVGEVPTLVVSSREAAREVMKTQDLAFASRPMSATLNVMTNGGRSLIFAPYGDHWRQIRRIAVVELLSARRVLSFRAVRAEEALAMVRSAGAAAAASRPLDLREALTTLVADYTVRAVMGDRCPQREEFLHELDCTVELAGGFNLADMWPSSRLVGWLSGTVERARKCQGSVFRLLDSIIAEHLERLGDGNSSGDDGTGGEAENLLDVLLKIHKDASLEIPLGMDAIRPVIFDLFAGSETSSIVLEWAMVELVRNPRSMRRATAEVRGAFAERGAVDEDALGMLPYLQHVIREAFRLHTPVPLLVPRECRKQCRLLGYDVPRGTTVLVNAWALGRDERYWPGDPEEFRPERFEEEAAGVDLKGADFELVPFGSGRRMCPGMPFGLAIVELALASLLLHFDWEVPGNADPAQLDMTEEFGITARRKETLLLRPILRVPVPGL